MKKKFQTDNGAAIPSWTPEPVTGDFSFADGSIFPTLNLHYATLGQPQKDANGVVRNAVLILHGRMRDKQLIH